jgi:hypothetical protein
VQRPLSLLALVASLAAGAGFVACDRPRTVAVRVLVPGTDSTPTAPTPVSSVGLVALPYDRDSVLKALEQRARTPRPSTARLDTLFAQFRGPFTAYAGASFAAGKLRDSLAILKRRLDSLPRNSAEYRGLYSRFGDQQRALAAVERRRDSAQVALDRARKTFAERGDSLRRQVRQWENSTYEGYDGIVEGLARARGREPVTDTTNTDGWAHLTLAGKGPWWIYARSWDASDPNAEWYWNVPVSGDSVRLDPSNGTRRPKY